MDHVQWVATKNLRERDRRPAVRSEKKLIDKCKEWCPHEMTCIEYMCTLSVEPVDDSYPLSLDDWPPLKHGDFAPAKKGAARMHHTRRAED